ncbi:MAG: UbiX family flavin prenyltransferase [Magnetococcales bacterium]|nr:UbiX family flavin prenyltransferase [Magnetococcales bacterium]
MKAIPLLPVTLAITGASGARYGLRLLERLLEQGRQVDLLLSDAGRIVIARECGLTLTGDGPDVARAILAHSPALPKAAQDALIHHAQRDWDAPMASGSRGARAMVICPCSMGTLAAVAGGLSDNLIERAADVALKERWPLILVPRETPLSIIHLENMLRLARSGAVILPAAPGFYQGASTMEHLIDFLVDRILDRLAGGF